MDKRRIIRKPYSFRGRMIAALMIGSLLATVISLFLAFCVTHINLLQELKVRERAVAIYLMELEQRTELRTDELARLMEQNGIEVAVLSDEDVAALSVGTQRELKRAGIAYEATTWKSGNVCADAHRRPCNYRWRRRQQLRHRVCAHHLRLNQLSGSLCADGDAGILLDFQARS